MKWGAEREREREKLTQAEEQVDAEAGVDAGPEEGGLGAPVPLGRVELAVGDDVDEGDVDGVVGVAREDDRLGAQPRRRHLGYDRVHHRPHREAGRRAHQQHHRARRPRLRRARRRVDPHETRYSGGFSKFCLFVSTTQGRGR